MWYNGGINWKAYAAYIVGVVPTIPGFSGSFKHPIAVGWVK
jgi:cytosine/uracil/thiamine/allantoin permease